MRKMPLLPFLLCVLLSCHKEKSVVTPFTGEALLLNDSVFKSDELSRKWSSAVQGLWDSELVCRRSDCGFYTVGDRRSEQWEFAEDSVRIYSTLCEKKKLLSVLKATYDGDTIRLECANNTPVEDGLKMHVILDQINITAIRGLQTFQGMDNCCSVFAVELTRVQQ